MYIRRKPNRTGSVSVQVISKHAGAYRVVRSFGKQSLERWYNKVTDAEFKSFNTIAVTIYGNALNRLITLPWQRVRI